MALERAKFDLSMLGDSLAVPGPTRATLSTTCYPLLLLARLMTTLDHLSRGASRGTW